MVSSGHNRSTGNRSSKAWQSKRWVVASEDKSGSAIQWLANSRRFEEDIIHLFGVDSDINFIEKTASIRAVGQGLSSKSYSVKMASSITASFFTNDTGPSFDISVSDTTSYEYRRR